MARDVPPVFEKRFALAWVWIDKKEVFMRERFKCSFMIYQRD